MRKYTFVIIALLLLANGRQPSAPVNDWTTQPDTAEPTPEPEPVAQPDSLPPIGHPWAGQGVDDDGYCPMLWGWGWNGSLLWPVQPEAIRPFGFLPGTTHTGTDLTVPVGTAVIAPASGVVVWAGYSSSGFGEMVAIGSSGRVIMLAHLSAVSVACGQAVTAGDGVGLSGQSGAASWPHVHLELRYGGLSWDVGGWLPSG